MSAIWPVRFDLLHSLHTGAVPLLLPSLVDGATLTSLPGDVDGAFRLRIAPPAGGRPPASPHPAAAHIDAGSALCRSPGADGDGRLWLLE
jgi:hypothetical protein